MKILNQSSLIQGVTISIPFSKSISNRALIINALSGYTGKINNLSTARDTQTMLRLLKSDERILDVLDAGTTMRFLTAYFSITNQPKILTGTERMQQRPIGILVDALREIGGTINYLKKEGFPPIRINGLIQKNSEISIRGDVSSQYISALLMIAPMLERGLSLTLVGKIGSKPYIDMTLALMKHYGVQSEWIENVIKIKPQHYISAEVTVEPDWSGASYWYSLVALSNNGRIDLEGFRKDSIQGDQVIADIMQNLGVETKYMDSGIELTHKDHLKEVSIDFTDCPDLVQTVAVVCAAKGIKCTMTGLASLKIKETNRVKALQIELAKIGAVLEERMNQWILSPSLELPSRVEINTYDDHRMAMAFAPLCLLMDVGIDDESVVDKSYPSFWTDVAKVCS